MNKEQIDSYLFAEMSDAEREKLEDSFMGDDELFAAIVSRENELVDAYIREELPGDERKRFERSLDSFPSRREKLSNAKMLREFIESERQVVGTITIAERKGFFSKVAEIFSFRSPAFQFAAFGLILILGLLSIVLLRENRRLVGLDGELAASLQREAQLTVEISNEREASSDLITDLNEERERIAELKKELSKVRQTNSNDRLNANVSSPTIATLFLSSAIIRDGRPSVAQLKVDPGVTRVGLSIEIPEEAATGYTVFIRLNGEVVASNVRVRTRAGEHIANAQIPAAKFKTGRNDIVVADGSGKVVVTYVVVRPENTNGRP